MAEQVDSGSELEEPGIVQKPSPGGVKGLLPFLLMAMLIPALLGATVAVVKYESLVAVGLTLGIDFGTKDVDEEPKSVTYGEFMQIEGMIINPADSHGNRYLLISVGLESHDPDVLAEVKQKEVVVRDMILKVLGDRTADELADVARRSDLKEAMRGALNDVLGQGEVDRMYFTQYVLQ